jgi:hypothetical protein
MFLVQIFFVLALAACAPREKPTPILTRPSNMTDLSLLPPPIVYVLEAQSLPGNFSERTITMSQAELDHFHGAWARTKPHVLARVQIDSLRGVSRWAKEEMENFSLPEDWLEKIPLRPMASFGDERLVRFGQFKEEGLPLPSHHPLVFRRLVLFADFDRRTQTIVQVIVSINGWVEE